MWGMIATWRMALEGVEHGAEMLAAGGDSGDATVAAVQEVENFPYYKSVGYGGLPNEEMIVELDAGYMDGDTLRFGAVGAVQDFANPVAIARRLSEESANNFLVGVGAEKFAQRHGFERKNMLTERAEIHYHNRLHDEQKERRAGELTPYDGHDTVGMVSLSTSGKVTVGTSTSGLFMKHAGRVGDSPIIGSGFFADSEIGGATATGMGEDLMKGLASYEIVRLMGEGMTPQAACEQVVRQLAARLKARLGEAGDLSVVAMDKDGRWGAASNIADFSFVVATAELAPTVYRVKPFDEDGKCHVYLADEAWLDDYMATRTAPLERK